MSSKNVKRLWFSLGTNGYRDGIWGILRLVDSERVTINRLTFCYYIRCISHRMWYSPISSDFSSSRRVIIHIIPPLCICDVYPISNASHSIVIFLWCIYRMTLKSWSATRTKLLWNELKEDCRFCELISTIILRSSGEHSIPSDYYLYYFRTNFFSKFWNFEPIQYFWKRSKQLYFLFITGSCSFKNGSS